MCNETLTSSICHVTTWSTCYVLCGRGSLVTYDEGTSPTKQVNHHPAKFGVHRPCESGDITFFIRYVTMISKCHMTLWVESSHPKRPPCQVWGP